MINNNQSRLSHVNSEFRERLINRNLYTIDNQYPLPESSKQKLLKSVDSIIDVLLPFKSINVSNSILGRLYTSPNTPLSEIGTLMYVKNMTSSLLSRTSKNLLPTLNPTNILFGKNPIIFNKDFKITKNNEKLSIDGFISEVTGYTFIKPFNVSKPIGFTSTTSINKVLNEDFGINLIENTGEGQLQKLFELLKYNKYVFNQHIQRNYFKKYTEYPYEFDIINSEYDINQFSVGYVEPRKFTDKIINENYENGFIPDDNYLIWGTGNKMVGLTGVLGYTNRLLNDSKTNPESNGIKIDITQEVFKINDNIGFNGSAMRRTLDDGSGIRQHTIINQYPKVDENGKLVKAIRFDGNKIYGGNKNSTIYNTVFPKIHPIGNNNKNMMFSIENLAFQVNSDGLILNDYNKTYKIPKSEVGPFNGRLMWFPPYDISINESSNSNNPSIIFFGREEPVYNHTHTERTATISFTLLVDYPPQLKNYRGSDKYKKIAEFFAFGDVDEVQDSDDISNIELEIKNYEKRIEEILGKKNDKESVISLAKENVIISYPNDEPNDVSNNVNTIFDYMFYVLKYETGSGISSEDGTNFGINENIYDYNNLVTSQYNSSDLSVPLNGLIHKFFSNEENRVLYDIVLESRTSKRFKGDNEMKYNLELGKRRSLAAVKFIGDRIRAIFGQTPEQLGINIRYTNNNLGSIGSAGAIEENFNSDEIVNREDIKLERITTIQFVVNGKSLSGENRTLNEDETRELDELRRNLDIAYVKLNKKKREYNIGGDNIGGDFVDGHYSGSVVSGNHFSNIMENKYIPVFHSQTPEDFHRRLTFLQQCVRQGASKRMGGVDGVRNSVFGRQPISILRIGDFFYTKVVINNVTVDYDNCTWDLNPEGFGLQPMLAKITLQVNIIGGQSLSGPISSLQNAISFNYYANSTFTNEDVYLKPSDAEKAQYKN